MDCFILTKVLKRIKGLRGKNLDHFGAASRWKRILSLEISVIDARCVDLDRRNDVRMVVLWMTPLAARCLWVAQDSRRAQLTLQRAQNFVRCPCMHVPRGCYRIGKRGLWGQILNLEKCVYQGLLMRFWHLFKADVLLSLSANCLFKDGPGFNKTFARFSCYFEWTINLKGKIISVD